MQRRNCHHSRAQSSRSSASLKRPKLHDELARKCLIVAFIVFLLPAQSGSAGRLHGETSNGAEPLKSLSTDLHQTSSRGPIQGLNRGKSNESLLSVPVESAQNQTNLSGQQQQQQQQPTPLVVVADDSSEPVISSDEHENSARAELDAEKPSRHHHTSQLNQSDVKSTGPTPPPPPPVVSSWARHEDEVTATLRWDEAEREADGSSSEGSTRQTSGLELETRGQQTSRLLLQLLVLGFFVLLSTSLVVVYSIKFCVCRRRKERRLLRRALIGDLTSSTRPLSHLQALHAGGNQLACAQQHQQPTDLSLLSTAQVGGFEYGPAQVTECGACSQWRCSFLQSFNHDDGDAHLQLEASSARRLQQRGAGELPPAQLGSSQPQLVLALLERLQQLLTTTASDISPSETAHSTIAARRVQQLGYLIAAQIGPQPVPPHPNRSVPLVGQSASAAAASGVCACQQVHVAPTSPVSLSSTRPPAYSELFLVDDGGGGDVTHEQPAARRGQAAPHQHEQAQRSRAGEQEEQARQQTEGREREREHEQQEAVVSLSSESRRRTDSTTLEETTSTTSQ